MNLKARFEDGSGGVVLITTEHSQSSYGIPVVVPTDDWTRPYMPDVCGPADLATSTPLVLLEDCTEKDRQIILDAGFKLSAR